MNLTLSGDANTPALPMTDAEIYAAADANRGVRFRTADEEGVQFDKHDLLAFARAVAEKAAAEERMRSSYLLTAAVHALRSNDVPLPPGLEEWAAAAIRNYGEQT